MTNPGLASLVAVPPRVDAAERARLADALRAAGTSGIVLATCHRVELHAADDVIASLADAVVPDAVVRLGAADTARHLVRVAVGLESAVLAEDQVLHQLRTAVAEARARGPLPPALDRLADVALAAGRRARSWQPVRRSLADAALDEAQRRLGTIARPLRVVVVGTGEMGRLAARAAAARRWPRAIASRTEAHAAALARSVNAEVLPFAGGPALAEADAVLVALGGPWTLDAGWVHALDRGRAVVVDMSAPRAVPSLPRVESADRLVLADDLALRDDEADTGPLRGRLERLANETVESFLAWAEAADRREAAAEIAARAEQDRRQALARLWHRLPDLAPEEREAIEAMTRRLADDLLREPLVRLRRDRAHEAAARELFGL